MEPRIYEQVVDECAKWHLDFVRITADGEPLLHKKIYDMMAYSSDKLSCPVGLTTNGSALQEKFAQKVIDTGLSVIDFSLDALTKETFEVVRAGLNYDQVTNNVLEFLKVRKAQGADLKIMVSFVNQKENNHELEAFKAYWTDKVDNVLIREMHENVNLISVRDHNNEAVKPHRWPCPHWFRRVVINYDGNIKGCPIDWMNDSIYQTLDKTSIFDAWHSDFYVDYRMQNLNNVYAEGSICGPCNDWKQTPGTWGMKKLYQILFKLLDLTNSPKLSTWN